MEEIRCGKCNKLLGKIIGAYEIKCPRCGEINTNIYGKSPLDDLIPIQKKYNNLMNTIIKESVKNGSNL